MILHQEIDSYLLGPCEQFLDTAETFVLFFYAFFDQVIKFCQQNITLFFQMLFTNECITEKKRCSF